MIWLRSLVQYIKEISQLTLPGFIITSALGIRKGLPLVIPVEKLVWFLLIRSMKIIQERILALQRTKLEELVILLRYTLMVTVLKSVGAN